MANTKKSRRHTSAPGSGSSTRRMRRVDASTLGNWPPGSLGTCNCAGMTPCYIRIQLPGTWLKKMMCPDCRSPRRIRSRGRPCLFQPTLSCQAMDALASGWMQPAMRSPFPLTYRGGGSHTSNPAPSTLPAWTTSRRNCSDGIWTHVLHRPKRNKSKGALP